MNYRHQLFTAAAGGSKQRSGLRRIVCLTALLFIFVASGVRAVPVSESTFPDANFRSALISSPGSDAIAINSTNFPDGNFRNYLLAQNYGKDGYLTEEEIAKIKQLDVSGQSISDLTGIEYFTALISLLCYNNNINEANMTKLVRSLPTGTYMRDLWVYKDGSSAEKNFFNLEHLNRAKDRYWSAMLFVGDTPAKFTDYVIYANFPDKNFRSYVSTNLDKNGDGWLLPSEIAAVTEINVDNKGIADLTGIEYFTNLTSLICCRNNLTTLDVSKNILLRHILCDRNQIRGKGMNTLVNSLHTSFIDNDWPEDWRPKLIVINGDATPVYNWITQSQVQNAESKGWEVMRYNNQYGYVDYAGELPGIPINEANFPDANFRAYVSGEDIDQDGDGYLNEMEVWWVTEINVSYLNISDLKGIEFFNGLKELNCSYNQLTSLDVSHNMALTRLYCYCNRIRGTDMTKLVNSLPDRKSASEEGTLWVYYIDDSPAGNMMTKVQVKIATDKNWNVVMWDDDYDDFIPYEGETPDGIEISEANFPDDNFRAYVGSEDIDRNRDGYLSDDEIVATTEINVSEMEIESLKGIEYFKKLEALSCFINQLTSLDVSDCSALRSLNCFGNQLTTLDLSKNTELTYLDCGFNQLTSLDLSKNTELTSLICFNNQLTSLDMPHNTALERLECYSNQIHGAAMTTLVNSLPDRKSASEKGTFEVYYDETPEGNMMTKVQVGIATDKNWNVWMYDDEEVYDWVPYEGEIIPGDANGDGEVNALDIDCLRDYILGLDPQPFSFESANLNGDSTVDIQDLTQLIEILLKR
jgi:Leucine-rich repeat (LRR) protein